MTYKFITEVAHDLQNEEGTADPERIDYLKDLATSLEDAIRRAAIVAATPAPQTPAEGSGFKAVKKFHEAKEAHQTRLEKANALVIYYRQWLTRMGGKLDAKTGQLDVAASQRVVLYDRQLVDQGLTKVRFENGLMKDANGALVDTSKMVTAFSGPGKAIYAMSAIGGHIHVSSHSVGERHHSSLLGATQAWIAGAGEIQVNQGRVQWISNKSGHYAPTLNHFLQVLHQLQKNGVLLSFSVTIASAGHRFENYATVDAFMQAKHFDDDSYDYLNLVIAYKNYLNEETLKPHGWVFRPDKARPGVYDIYEDRLIPHRDARRWLSHNSHKGQDVQHSGAGR